MMEKKTIIGAGSWGTTLACLLAGKGFDVALWARNPELCQLMAETRENSTYLPGVKLPTNLRPTASLEDALSGSDFVVCAIPSHGIREIFGAARAMISKDAVIVSAAKGIEDGTHLGASGILGDVLEGTPHKGIAVLSGPSFAAEVSRGLPAAVSAASASAEAASITQQVFSTPVFRVYTSPDVTGVETGGALKNVIAIASGISDGMGLGNNARAALITRGLAEISRLGVKMGANPLTFSGLSGLGDLVLTCTGSLSRNYTVGVEIGRGRTLDDIMSGMQMVAEGVRTSKAACSLGRGKGVDMPITRGVYEILYEGKSARSVVFDLMTRELKGELG